MAKHPFQEEIELIRGLKAVDSSGRAFLQDLLKICCLLSEIGDEHAEEFLSAVKRVEYLLELSDSIGIRYQELYEERTRLIPPHMDI